MNPTFFKKHVKNCNIGSDINQHLSILFEYACKVKHITEFGVRCGVSTQTFLASAPEKMVSYDIQFQSELMEVINAARDEGLNFDFILEDTLTTSIEPTDLLFIDTEHTSNQLLQELERHSSKVSNYILIHDTLAFPELKWAIFVFLARGIRDEWSIEDCSCLGTGLTIMKRSISSPRVQEDPKQTIARILKEYSYGRYSYLIKYL